MKRTRDPFKSCCLNLVGWPIALVWVMDPRATNTPLLLSGPAALGQLPDMKAMLADDFRNRFETSAAICRASRISKLRRGHFKLVYSKLLALVARGLGISVKRRARLFWGEEMTVVYPEISSLAISRYGFYEEGLTKMVLASLKPGMTFIDVGAYVGYFTLLAAWLVGSKGQAHSFEPTPSTFEVLLSNTELNHNVYSNRIAVAAGPGIVTLNDYGPVFSGYNPMYRARMSESALNRVKSTKFQATANSLDEYVARERVTPNFIKIDAESAEYEILKGMDEILNRCRPMISIEVGDHDIEGVLASRDLVLYLIKKRYQAYEFSGGGIVRHQLRKEYEYDNILFLPEGQIPPGSMSLAASITRPPMRQ